VFPGCPIRGTVGKRNAMRKERLCRILANTVAAAPTADAFAKLCTPQDTEDQYSIKQFV